MGVEIYYRLSVICSYRMFAWSTVFTVGTTLSAEKKNISWMKDEKGIVFLNQCQV